MEKKQQEKKNKAADKKHRLSVGAVLSTIACVILVPVIIINLVLIISTYIRPDEMPGIFGIKPVTVLSGSMEPEFASGDLIFVKQAPDNENLKEGDVICYLLSGKAVTHRIVGISTDEQGNISYITRGDANNTDDSEAVLAEQIQGIYTGTHFAKVGDFAMFMQSTTGMIVFIVCPLVLFILWDVFRRMMWDKKEKSRTAELEAELEALKAQKKQ